MLRLADFVWELRNHRLEQLPRALRSVAARLHRWLTTAGGECPAPPPRPCRDFVASLRLVNGTLECPPQEDPHPYRDLPGGFSKRLRGALFPPWIIKGQFMTPWEAHIACAEWAREWSRWCAPTRAPGTPTPQYAAIPLKGWGLHTRPRPTVIRGEGPERLWDAATTEWLQAAADPHTGWRGDLSSLLRAPPPPRASCSTAPTRSEPRRYTHGGAKQQPSGGSPRRNGEPGSLWRISQEWGLRTMTPCPGWQNFRTPAPHAPDRPRRRAAPGARRLRRAEGGMRGDCRRHPAGPPPPRHRRRVPVGSSYAPLHRASDLHDDPPGAPMPGVG